MCLTIIRNYPLHYLTQVVKNKESQAICHHENLNPNNIIWEITRKRINKGSSRNTYLDIGFLYPSQSISNKIVSKKEEATNR